jgi:hypothetical protein
MQVLSQLHRINHGIFQRIIAVIAVNADNYVTALAPANFSYLVESTVKPLITSPVSSLLPHNRRCTPQSSAARHLPWTSRSKTSVFLRNFGVISFNWPCTSQTIYSIHPLNNSTHLKPCANGRLLRASFILRRRGRNIGRECD